MNILTGKEHTIAEQRMLDTAKIATLSTCYRSKCGAIIVKDSLIIGQGYNSPPQNCSLDYCLKDDLPNNFKSDKTCCLHAEQRAIRDAYKRGNGGLLQESTIYFIRLNLENEILKAGKPYCTICSKEVLDAGVSEFVLWHDEGITVYDTDEYNEISFGRISWVFKK